MNCSPCTLVNISHSSVIPYLYLFQPKCACACYCFAHTHTHSLISLLLFVLFSVHVQIAFCFLLIYTLFSSLFWNLLLVREVRWANTCSQGFIMVVSAWVYWIHLPEHVNTSHILSCFGSCKSWSFWSYNIWLTLLTLEEERSIWFWEKGNVFPTVNSIKFWIFIFPSRRNRSAMLEWCKSQLEET